MPTPFKKPGNYIWSVWEPLMEEDSGIEDFNKFTEIEESVIVVVDISGFTVFFNNLISTRKEAMQNAVKKFLDLFFTDVCEVFDQSITCHPFKFLGDGVMIRCELSTFKTKFNDLVGAIKRLQYQLKSYVKSLIDKELCVPYDYERELGITSISHLCHNGLYFGGINTNNYFDGSYFGRGINALAKAANSYNANKRFSLCLDLHAKLEPDQQSMFGDQVFNEYGIDFKSI